MKHNAFKKFALMCLGLSSIVALGCGGNGASNNDQGVAVTFLGFFQSADTTNGVSGAYIRLAAPGTEPSSTAYFDQAGGLIAYAGVRNNLIGQSFRVDRLLYTFTVPGASSQPPSTNYPVSMVAGPGSSGDTTFDPNNPAGGTDDGIRRPGTTSLPPGFTAQNPVVAQVPLVPFQIMEWLNFNRGSLPEPPFLMEVSVRAAGLTSSGDRLETNTETLGVTVLPENFVAPTDGTASSDTGTNGAFTGSLSDTNGDGSSSSTDGSDYSTPGEGGASL